MNDRRPLLEICVDDPAGVAAAIAGGADRLELCSALALGGLTPSTALAAMALRAARPANVQVYAMVRPRAGDFAYDEVELTLAIDEAAALLAVGVDGLVFGAARGGALQMPALARWIGAVRALRPGVLLTLHRAVDTLDDPVAAIGPARSLGFTRVLTSGGAAAAVDGIAAIVRMVEAADGRLAVMAGAGVTPATVPALLAAGVGEIHASARRDAAPVDPPVALMGFDDPPRRVTDQALVRGLREALDRATDRE